VKAPELYRRLAPLGRLANKRALSPAYRAMALASDLAGAAAPYGAMQCAVELAIDQPVSVDAEDFLRVLHSLPDSEFVPAVDEHALRWRCGPAKGHLALLDAGLQIPKPVFDGDVGAIDNQRFAAGLELAALACGGPAVRSFGLESVQLHTTPEHTWGYATDSIALSSACLGAALPLTAPVTLKPEAAALLSSVVRSTTTNFFVGGDAGSVYAVTDDSELQLYQLTVTRHDLAAQVAPLRRHEIELPLFREAVAGFLKRAEGLGEERGSTLVEIAVKQGRTLLGFSVPTGSSEEYYDVTDAPPITVPPITVEVRRLARALAHADYLVFDQAAEHRLVLRGEHDFVYGIGGRRS
jgi:hypothetical protein